jgi:amino acid transporter
VSGEKSCLGRSTTNSCSCHYIAIPVYAFGYIGYKLVRKTKAVKLHEMDLTSGSREFWDLGDYEEEDAKYENMSFKDKFIYQLKNW